MKKSVIAAFILAFLFGPLGLLYSSVIGGIILIVLALLMGAVAGPFALFTWLVAVIWAPVAAMSHNSAVDAQLNKVAKAAADSVPVQVDAPATDEDWDTLAKYDDGVKAAIAKVERYGEGAVAELRKAHEVIKDKDQLLRIADQIAGDYA